MSTPPSSPGSHASGATVRPWHDPSLRAALSVLPLRLFLAAGWLRASAEKLIDVHWWHGDVLREFLTAQHDAALPYFRPVMEDALRPLAVEVAAVVAVGQLLIGLALLVGRPLRTALWGGVVLNVVFVMAGRVNPSAFYLVMEAALLAAVATGVIARAPRPASARSLVVVLVAVGVALVHVPQVRTIEPAAVIEDPAMMLIFLAVIVAVTTSLRWVLEHLVAITVVTDVDSRHVWSWLLCRPQPSVASAVDQELTEWTASTLDAAAPDRRDPPVEVWRVDR